MKIYFNQLEKQLTESFSSCYLIVGDEPLSLKEASDSIRTKAQSLGFSERQVIHVDAKFKWETLLASTGTLSLFAEKKLIEIHIPNGKPGAAGSKAIVQFVENLPQDICLLIRCEQWTASSDRTKWVKCIEQNGTFMRVYLPKGNEFITWIKNRCRQIELNTDHESTNLLSLRLEGNLLAAAQELEKLKMRFGSQQITAKDVASLVADSARFDVFRLTDALLENKLARVLRMVRALKQNNTAIVVIHWALERQVRTLLHFAYFKQKGLRIGPGDYRKQGIWQSQQALIQYSLNRLTAKKLQNLLAKMALLDRIIKGQAPGNPWLELEQWLVDYCQ